TAAALHECVIRVLVPCRNIVWSDQWYPCHAASLSSSVGLAESWLQGNACPLQGAARHTCQLWRCWVRWYHAFRRLSTESGASDTLSVVSSRYAFCFFLATSRGCGE